jgi:phage baseplate assembly protein V
MNPLSKLQRQIRLIASRAVVRLVDDALRLQGLQLTLLADETRDQVERFQNYGFTSHPHAGAEAVAIALGGSRDHLVAIAVDDRRYRLKGLAAGEVALYTDEGDTVILKRGRVVEVTTQTLLVKAGTKVRFETPLVETTGQVKADGDITDLVQAGGKSMANMRDTYNSHTHPGDSGGTTGTPNQGM